MNSDDQPTDSPGANPDPRLVARAKYFVTAGDAIATHWAKIATDDWLAAAWLAGRIELLIDREGMAFRTVGEDPDPALEEVAFPGYL